MPHTVSFVHALVYSTNVRLWCSSRSSLPGALGLSLEAYIVDEGGVTQEIVVVDNCIEGTPAAECGVIESGDILIEVEGNSTQGLNFDEVTSHFAGRDSIKLTFLRRTMEE
jgi:C-terminal processing protease CtpA/Prc